MRDFRADLLAGLDRLARGEAAHDILDEAVAWDVSAPVESLAGRLSVRDGFFAPLRTALKGLHRRDEIFIGGPNRRAEGGDWAAAVTHYVGTFRAPLWGVAPTQKLVFLRAGEFYRIDDGRVTKARIIVDLVDLLRQCGRRPFTVELGAEMLFPGPATHDGVLPAERAQGEASLDVVEAMLAALGGYDPETFSSPAQTGADGAWSDEMFWWGPGGIGSTYRWDGFVDDHRAAFLRAFPDRVGGDHYCRIGDGAYAAISGWPSMRMTHQGDYLGVRATGRALTLRVMDFYRLAGGKIAENWVLLDYVDLFRQMGFDPIAAAAALR